MRTHTGGCHCGRVRFEVIAPAKLEVADCSVNARCIDSDTIESISVKPFEGRDWEAGRTAYRDATDT
jgi:hypothetical protein